MAKAIYYDEYCKGRAFEIKAKNEDGTIDLANDKGEVVVRKCTVTKEAKPGAATLGDKPAEPAAEETIAAAETATPKKK